MPDLPANPPTSWQAGGRAGWQWQVRRFESLDSTNRYVLDEARAGAPSGLVVVADHQTAGRGRLGRSWEASPGSSLLVSVLLRPELLRPSLPGDRLSWITLAAGLALADALEGVAGFAPGLKWPNDLVVDDRKLAGLLAEADVVAGTARAVVVGAGCNLTADAYPPDLAAQATAAEREAGHPVERDVLLAAFLDALAARLERLPSVVDDARARSATLYRRVRVDQRDRDPLEGIAVDLAVDGSLVLCDDDGREHTIAVGDVVHLRPTD